MLRRVVCRPWAPSAAARFVTITPLAMPALSPTMKEGNLTEWVKQVGQSVNPGDELAKIETDKATISFENVGDEGFLARHLVEAGAATVQVGTVVALLVEEEADINSDEVKNWKPEAAAAAAPAATEESKPAESSASAKSSSSAPAASSGNSGERVFASPLARKTAADLGLDLSAITGTGGSVGRVTKDDVVAASKNPSAAKAAAKSDSEASSSAAKSEAPAKSESAAPAAAPAAAAPAGSMFESIPVSGMRKTIASRLTQSKNVDVPHYYLMQECKVDSMLAVVKQLNAKGKGEYKITVNDYIIKAVARANLIVPECNTHWHGDHMRKYSTVDVSVAVATPSGLITPIVRDAHAKGLAEISMEVKALAKKAREGGLAPEQYQGGTVSVSNLGAAGIDQFTAIINPPQSTILAIGTTLNKPEIAENEDGELVVTGKVDRVINFTASFDHRVVDGAIGAQWFKAFKDTIENPLSLLL